MAGFGGDWFIKNHQLYLDNGKSAIAQIDDDKLIFVQVADGCYDKMYQQNLKRIK